MSYKTYRAYSMMRKLRLPFPAFFILLLSLVISGMASDCKKPNFVVIFTDDQGYGDLSCFGGKHVNTPRIDKMAAEGSKLTSFYVAAPVCTPSRAALMTGCYPKRVDMATGSDFIVVLAADPKGLNPKEITMAEVLKTQGYQTGIFGKWHLGDHDDTRPHMRGFDESSGLMYSNDMWRHHPLDPKIFRVPLKYWKNGKIIIEDFSKADQKNLTKWSAEDSVDFINRQKDKPFFLYVPFSMPHVPLYVSKEFENRSGLPMQPLQHPSLMNCHEKYPLLDGLNQ